MDGDDSIGVRYIGPYDPLDVVKELPELTAPSSMCLGDVLVMYEYGVGWTFGSDAVLRARAYELVNTFDPKGICDRWESKMLMGGKALVGQPLETV